jgi:hypothetical protein
MQQANFFIDVRTRESPFVMALHIFTQYIFTYCLHKKHCKQQHNKQPSAYQTDIWSLDKVR